MSENRPSKDFGKRRPSAPPPSTPPVKRSGHVALLVMGTIAVGTTAYTLMPRSGCEPSPPGVAGTAPPNAGCTSRSSSSGGGHGSSRAGFYSSDSSNHSSSGGSSDSGSGGVTRGGFGSFAHGFFSGGG